ncbi:hypothetical protein ABW21_db0201334 [Orbilia brochopaga]|nr:hypothetical protein ABW21_db0201334 [Drechslerella brochopaga]
MSRWPWSSFKFIPLYRWLLPLIWLVIANAHFALGGDNDTVVITVTTILTPTIAETLDARQDCPFFSLDFCSDVQLSWLGSTQFGSMNGTTGTESASASGGSTGGASSTSSAAPGPDIQYDRIIAGTPFQLFLLAGESTYYVKLDGSGFAYLVPSASDVRFQWTGTSIVTYQEGRTLFALPDSAVSSLFPRQADIISSRFQGNVKANSTVPSGASTNFTLVPNGNVAQLVLAVSGLPALFGTGQGCSSDPDAPSNGLAFNLIDDFDSLPDCQQVAILAAVQQGIPSASTSISATSSASNSGSGSGISQSTGAISSSSSSSTSTRRTSSRRMSTDTRETTGTTETSRSTGSSSIDTRTHRGLTTTGTSSSQSASPGSTGPSSPSDTSQPCSGSTCSASDTGTGTGTGSSSSDPCANTADCTGCLATAQIPASLSCPGGSVNDYVTISRRVYSLCTSYSLTGLDGVETELQGGAESTLSLLPCLQSCVDADCTGMAFKVEQGPRPTQTWACLFETDNPQSYVAGTPTTYIVSEYTAAVYICSNSFDDYIAPPDPTRNTLLIPTAPCERVVDIPTGEFCPGNTATGAAFYQYFTTTDSTVFTICPEGQFTGTTYEAAFSSTATTFPLPFTLSDCISRCSAITAPNPCVGAEYLISSPKPPNMANGNHIFCIFGTESDAPFTTSLIPTPNHVIAAREICTNTFAYTGCAELLAATPATASCCQGHTGFLYTAGSSVFNVCPGCYWPSSTQAGPSYVGTQNAIFIDNCISSCTGCTAVGMASFTSSAIGGTTFSYACNTPTETGLAMTDASPAVLGTVWHPTAAAFLCTNSFSIPPSPPITSPLTPTFPICVARISSVLQAGTTAIYKSILGGASITYGHVGGDLIISTLVYTGCDYGCTDPVTATARNLVQLCAGYARSFNKGVFEVIRYNTNQGLCECHVYNPPFGYVPGDFSTAVDVLENYAYTTTV